MSPQLSTRKILTFKACSLILGVFVTVIAAEGAYRIKLLLDGAFSGDKDLNYKVSAHPFANFDEEFGVHYTPQSKGEYFYVSNGKVSWCPGPFFITNVDGLTGITTVSKYDTSKLKILVFGDSFTYWNQQGKTWPDLLEEKLSGYYATSVGVLNFGRGGYGVLQMAALAAKMAELYRPHLVIFAFITYDLKRDRWWTKTIEMNGYQRNLMSPQTDNFDLRIAADSVVINSRTSHRWCVNNLNKSGDDVLRELNRQFRELRASIYKARGYRFYSLLSLTDIYLYNRIVTKISVLRPIHALPSVEFDNFRNDDHFVVDMESIKKYNYCLVHLPVQNEIESGRIIADDQSRALFESLSSIVGGKLYTSFEYLKNHGVPSKIDLSPNDPHPNYDGLEMYSDIVFELIRDKTPITQF